MTLTEANIKGLANVDFDTVGEYKVTVEVTDAAGNKAEVEVAISVAKEGECNLIYSTIDPQKHELSTGLIVSKTGGGQWDWIGLDVEGADYSGYTKMVAEFIGPNGTHFAFKVNDQFEKRVDATGEVVHVDFDLPANAAWNNSNHAMIMFPDIDIAGLGNEFAIVKLELQGEGKEPIDLLAGKVTLSGAVVSARKMVILTKPTTDSDEWTCAKFKVSDDLSGYAAIQYAVMGTAGEKIIIKPNDNGAFERTIVLDGTVQTGIIDLSGMKYNPGSSAMIFFVNPAATGTGNPVYIFELTYLLENPNGNPGSAEVTAVNQSSTSFASWDELKTVTFTGLPATNSGSNGWARWDYSSVTGEGYTDVVVKFRATPGLRICAKLDALTTPANNAYDSIAGNKTTQVVDESGLITFTWNLAEFEAAATAAGKAFAVENLRKLVVFPSSGLEGVNIFARYLSVSW